MKVADELLVLAKEHHISLALGNKAVNVAKSGSLTEIDALCLQISTTFRASFQTHFETEEKAIFTPLKGKSAELDALCTRLINEHQKLYQLAQALVEKPDLLAEFGTLLKTHTRAEDRELFPNIALLTNGQRKNIKQLSAKHPKINKVKKIGQGEELQTKIGVKVVAEDLVIDTDKKALDLDKIMAKLTKARTQLMLDKPFLGNLVLRLPLVVADDWCKTSATDAKNFYYNPAFIDALDNSQIKFVLIHEALHCALTHFARRGMRSKHKWDLACDFAINPLLIKEGFRPPIEVPIYQQYEGMIAEEIYPMIADNLNQQPMDQHLYDDFNNDNLLQSSNKISEDQLQNSSPKQKDKSKKSQSQYSAQFAQQPKPLQPDEIDKLASQWQKNLASSAQLAQQAGRLSAEFAKLIGFFLQPQVPWQSLLAQYMSAFAYDDFTYSRPSRRMGDAIFPSLKSRQMSITVAIDISGSISQDEIDKFTSEINAIKANIRASITLIACDDKLAQDSPWHFEAWEKIQFPDSFGGGGGTDFNPVFDYIKTKNTPNDVLIYFTDAKGRFPKSEPNYPVLWLVKGKQQVPWGSRIQLN